MAGFTSMLPCISIEEGKDIESTQDATDELSESDKKELNEVVDDLLSIQNPEVLKRNITNIVKDKLLLRKKILKLESQVQVTSKTDSCLSFQIDCDGLASDEESHCETQDSTIQYDASESVAMGAKEKPTSPVPTKGNKCFNCGGNHNLAECKEEKDPRKIAKNRREFMNSSVGMSSARYHIDDPQKFGHLTPGLPSKKLSEALGLKRDNLPAYIYRLRDLGYPPGWLKHAEISHSGMTLYLEEGRKLDTGEEGELVDKEAMIKYDTKKLISWPGFNTEMPRNYRDETDRYRASSMARVYSLRDMKRDMKGKEQTGYKKGKMQDVSTDNFQPADMETDEDCEILANNTIDLAENSHDPLPVAESTVSDELTVNGSVADIKRQEEKVKQISGSRSVSKTDAGKHMVNIECLMFSLY